MIRAAIRRAYGFDFPDDLLAFWSLAKALHPKNPRAAFQADLGIVLLGPFDILAGKKTSAGLLTGRWVSDPPELFTVMSGDSDGLHWGYVLDHPGGRQDAFVAHFFSRDGYPIIPDGPTLFHALRKHLEDVYGDIATQVAEMKGVGEIDRTVAKRTRRLDRVRDAIVRFATEEHSGRGRAFAPSRFVPRAAAPTFDGLGALCKSSDTRALGTDAALVRKLRSEHSRARLLQKIPGPLGARLKLGRDLLCFVEVKERGPAYDLLEETYRALDRAILADVVAACRRRDLAEAPSAGPRRCTSFEEAMRDPGSVTSIAIERWGTKGKARRLQIPADAGRLSKLASLSINGALLEGLDALAKMRALVDLTHLRMRSRRSPRFDCQASGPGAQPRR